MSEDRAFATLLTEWMTRLDLKDKAVAQALLSSGGDFGLFPSLVKRVGYWRRGSSSPQDRAKVAKLEHALRARAAEAGIELPEDALVTAWSVQRRARRTPPRLRPLHKTTLSLKSGSEGDAVDIVGVVGQVRGRGGILFFDVSDAWCVQPTQFGVQHDEVSETCWDTAQSLEQDQRVHVHGVLGVNRRGDPIVWVDEPPQLQQAITDKTFATAAPEQRRVGASIVTAAVRATAEAHLTSQDFVAIATRVLSPIVSRDDHAGLHRLTVIYSGFGMPAYITASPALQLHDAIIVGGADRVFTSGHCFTTSLRDDLDGVETEVVMAKTLGGSLSDAVTLAHQLIGEVGALLQTPDLCAETLPIHLGARGDLSCRPERLPHVVVAEMHSAHDVARVVHAFRLYVSESCAPIEGAIEPFAGGTTVCTLAIFPSRFLPLAHHTPIRRIFPLGRRQ